LATAANVIAETASGNPNNVVMAGGHLDSVNGGPGIQDNGSGVAALLETAIQMAKAKTNNKVRFAFWGAEESGLVGSTYYVNSLTQAERDQIALYLNFDMIGSPNHGFFVYDGDDSDQVGAGPGPDGSKAIEAAFQAYFDSFGVPTRGTDFSGRSDFGPFIAKGIPAGGLFTGAEGIKTAEQVALWGGTAGQQFDPCYHQACDTYANVNEYALGMNADALAQVVASFAADTVAVNGVEGKGKKKSRDKLKEQLEYWGPQAIR
jgi:aminopeptidase Y